MTARQLAALFAAQAAATIVALSPLLWAAHP